MTSKPIQNKPARGAAGQIAEERLVRLRLQNEKLQNEVRRLKGEFASVEQLKSEVIRANSVVKAQLLAIPFRIASRLMDVTDPKVIAELMTAEITQCLNDLAYGTPTEDDICPYCGRKKEKVK